MLSFSVLKLRMLYLYDVLGFMAPQCPAVVVGAMDSTSLFGTETLPRRRYPGVDLRLSESFFFGTAYLLEEYLCIVHLKDAGKFEEEKAISYRLHCYSYRHRQISPYQTPFFTPNPAPFQCRSLNIKVSTTSQPMEIRKAATGEVPRRSSPRTWSTVSIV